MLGLVTKLSWVGGRHLIKPSELAVGPILKLSCGSLLILSHAFATSVTVYQLVISQGLNILNCKTRLVKYSISNLSNKLDF